MIQIRPIPDLQNDYNSIEKSVLENDQTIYLTKNVYGYDEFRKIFRIDK